jgi:hypothetical protein
LPAIRLESLISGYVAASFGLFIAGFNTAVLL